MPSGNDRRPIFIAAMTSLVLIAALTGISWQHRSTIHQSLGNATTGPGVVRETVGPIPMGAMISGPSPADWAAVPSGGILAMTPVPGGEEMRVTQTGYDEWHGVPIPSLNPSIVVQGDVQFIAGGSDNGIGLGCLSVSNMSQLGFHVYEDKTWALAYYPPGNGAMQDLDSGYSSALRSTNRVNLLTISCMGADGGTKVMAAVNGVTVVNDVANVPTMGWDPAIDQCSCDGVDTGRFTNISLFAP